jgi:hypothetical protein
MWKTCAAIAAAAAGLMGASSALAHHSFAMFDQTRQVTLKGTVKEFQWTNPHAWIEIEVQNEQGQPETWGVELNSPNNLIRQGWKHDVMKPGDKVTVIINPLKDGSKGGLFDAVYLANGSLLGDPRPPRGPINVQAP